MWGRGLSPELPKYLLNNWHILISKGMSGFTSDTLLIRIQYKKNSRVLKKEFFFLAGKNCTFWSEHSKWTFLEKTTLRFNGCFLGETSLAKNLQMLFRGWVGGNQPCFKSCCPYQVRKKEGSFREKFEPSLTLLLWVKTKLILIAGEYTRITGLA